MTDRTAVLRRDTTYATASGQAGTVPPGVYLIAPSAWAAERGEMLIELAGGLVSINPDGVPVAEGTVPFVSADGHRPGFVAGECGHAVAGSEWLAGMKTCERCA